MPFVLDPAEPVQREIRRVTRERLDEALTILADMADAEPHEIEQAVHDVRKRCKEVRSVARLVRSALGDEYAHFNALVRDAADELAPIRDAHALLATFDDLRATTGRADVELDAVRAAQESAAQAATRRVLGSDPRIERARALLEQSRASVDRWKIPRGADTIMSGLEDTYRRGQRDRRRALERPTDRRVHQWRTSTKHLWYQLRLVERAAPSVLEPLIAHLDDLAEALGDDHDLAVLAERLRATPKRFGGKRPAKRARRLARRQQDELRRRAFRLASTIYAETPKAFARRLAAYWDCTVNEGAELATGGIAELADDERHDRGSDSTSPSSVERERKFLVDEPPALTESGTALRQGYLAIDGSVSVRVRDAGDDYTLTLKAGRGAVRTEFEWPLTREQFETAWDQTRGRRIHKTRHRIPLDDHVVELDVFHDELDGLVVAEVEFDRDDALAAFRPPDWFGPEVTDDVAYTNASLATNAMRGLPTRPTRQASAAPPSSAPEPAATATATATATPTATAEQFAAILTGGHPNSLGRTEEVVEAVLADRARLAALYECYFCDDAVVRLRVSSAMKRVTVAHPDWTIELMDGLQREVAAIDQASTQWTLAVLFDLTKDLQTAEQRTRSVEIMRHNLADHDDWIVLNTTMRVLHDWSDDDPELAEWIVPHLERLTRDRRTSVARRAAKLLATAPPANRSV